MLQSIVSAFHLLHCLCRPLSMSENLTKLAHKIDFSKDEMEDKGKPTSEGIEEESGEEEEKVATTALQRPSLGPWDSVRTKLRSLSNLYF